MSLTALAYATESGEGETLSMGAISLADGEYRIRAGHPEAATIQLLCLIPRDHHGKEGEPLAVRPTSATGAQLGSRVSLCVRRIPEQLTGPAQLFLFSADSGKPINGRVEIRKDHWCAAGTYPGAHSKKKYQ